ncbi:MAG: DNA-binding protein WhiA [Lachnospiraceae bacterium]|nr:DNA-binding protein WhiA [Lachnospiraceae bacterium]
MSFSGKVKEELSYQHSPQRHCQIAEITAITMLCGCIAVDKYNRFSIKIQTENVRVARKYFTLLKKAFNIDCSFVVRQRKIGRKTRVYLLKVGKHEDALKVLKAAKILDMAGNLPDEICLTNQIVVQKDCCKRAFIRGAFLAIGSVNDPEKSYHLELVADNIARAELLVELIRSFHIDARIVERKGSHVVYVKEAEGISDFLNLMESHVQMMEFENIRILKEISNTVNRQVNCETANLNKTVTSAVKQIEDIHYIQETAGLEILAPTLRDTARARLTYPSLPLKDLGEKMVPSVGKSGINHRLRKISEIADELRKGKNVSDEGNRKV